MNKDLYTGILIGALFLLAFTAFSNVLANVVWNYNGHGMMNSNNGMHDMMRYHEDRDHEKGMMRYHEEMHRMCHDMMEEHETEE